jgi:hypothetical protein
MLKIDAIALQTSFFRDFGFEYNFVEKFFFKEFPIGKQIINLNFSEYSNTNYLEYTLGIRINRVENLIQKFLPNLMNHSDRSVTLLLTPHKINKNLPVRYVIETEAQLHQAMESAERFFITKGFIWLDSMIDPLNLEKAFISQKDKPSKSQKFVYNMFRATALTRLYSPKDYNWIRQFYLGKIKDKDMTPFSIAAYLQFLGYLDKVPV